MNPEELREVCLMLPAVEESTPFDETTLVYKVGGRIFALADTLATGWVNCKCEPDAAVELRDRHPDDILPGRHMNKRHWNTVHTEGDLPDSMVRAQIVESYRLVVAALPRALRDAIRALAPELHKPATD